MTLFDLPKIEAELERSSREIEQEDFWSNLEYAQKIMKEKKSMENTLDGYNDLKKTLEDIEELTEMAEAEDDEAMASEIQSMFDGLQEELEAMRVKTLLTGKYDGCGAIIVCNYCYRGGTCKRRPFEA